MRKSIVLFSIFTCVQWICFVLLLLHERGQYETSNLSQEYELFAAQNRILELEFQLQSQGCTPVSSSNNANKPVTLQDKLCNNRTLNVNNATINHPYIRNSVENMIFEEDLDCFYETKYSGAILYLGPKKNQTLKIHKAPMNRTDIMMTSLRRLHSYYNYQHKYPIFIFHEDYTKEDMQRFREQYGHPLHFVRVSFEHLPDCATRASNEEFEKWMSKYRNPIGYRQMCRFWSGIVQNAPILSSFEYYMRFDDDTMMYAKVSNDVFEKMSNTNKTYMYQQSFVDKAHSTQLWNTTRLWMLEYKRLEITTGEWLAKGFYGGSAPYNNFHASRFDIWRSKEAGDLFEHLEATQCGFFQHAWGDANYHATALMALRPQSAIVRVHSFPVQHNWNYAKIKTGDPDAWAFF